MRSGFVIAPADLAALAQFGLFAVGSLPRALPWVSSPRQRVVLIAILMSCGRHAESLVSEALLTATKRVKHPHLRRAAIVGRTRVMAEDVVETAKRNQAPESG